MIKVLEETAVPLNRTQIAEKLKNTPVAVSKMIGILLKHGDINCIELDRYQSAKLLGWKIPARRSRFYYIKIKFKGVKKWQELTS